MKTCEPPIYRTVWHLSSCKLTSITNYKHLESEWKKAKGVECTASPCTSHPWMNQDAFRWERSAMRFEGILYNVRQPQARCELDPCSYISALCKSCSWMRNRNHIGKTKDPDVLSICLLGHAWNLNRYVPCLRAPL